MNYVCALVSIKYDIKALNINTHTQYTYVCVYVYREYRTRISYITIFITC